MSKKEKIGIFVGSLRQKSFSKCIANFITETEFDSVEFEIIELGELPIYNQDFDDIGPTPSSYTDFRTKVSSLDGFLFITPEYNRSVPAVLKNALDVGSRPYGKSVWNNKPGAIISQSPGHLSGFGANHHLRQSLVFLNVLPMQQPEAYIAKITDCIDEDGNISNKNTQQFLKDFIYAFEKWIKVTKHS